MNKKKIFFPLVSVAAGSAALVMSLSLGEGGNQLIERTLSGAGKNSIIIGGNFTDEEGAFIRKAPFVEKVIFLQEDRQRMIVSFPSEESGEDYIPVILKRLKNYMGEEAQLSILATPDVYRRTERITRITDRVLGILSFISLALGSLGMMNMGTVLVKERTHAIGILRSMGVGRQRIRDIFLMEALLISAVGALLGTVLGVIGAYIAGEVLAIPPVFLKDKTILSLAVSVGTGILGVLKPAIDAGKMKTIDALKL